MPEDGPSDIGYKRPPTHSQFKPGRSGNPAGRPKGALNLETELSKELTERITIREGERSFKVSKQRALLKSMVAKALKGDTRAAGLVLQLVTKLALLEDVAQPSEQAPLSEDEAAILERFIAKRLAEPK